MQTVVNFVNQIGTIGGLVGLGWAAWGAGTWPLAFGENWTTRRIKESKVSF